ncbi:MAG: nucleotidyltransferase domain-containing protein [Candidatus Woesearchaeota archaeon]|nr:nucleotidyltransferase domain-containing protein [Candidatus Woesearchaeota archaeon]
MFEDVVKENKVENEKEVFSKIISFIDKIKKSIKKNRIKAIAQLGGSAAKGTFLRDFDVDIFVKFALSYKNEALSDILERILKIFNNARRVHGSRDYFEVIENSINYEIIPVLNIKKPGDAKNVTDFSPLHVKWVKKNIGNFQNDILLAKLFCKAQGVYGAESYIGGFSGHIIDILVIYYKGFLNLLKNSLKWGDGEIIDVMHYYKNKRLDINKSKLSPLIIIDPLQKGRNAAAALRKEKIEKFREAAVLFLKSPSRDFFVKKKMEIKEGAAIIEATPLDGKEDVVGSKLLKVFDFIKTEIALNDFQLEDSGWEFNDKKTIMWFLVKNKILSKTKIHEGPPLKAAKHVENFKNKYKKTFIKNNRIYAEVSREFINIDELIKNSIKADYVTEKIKKINLK